MKTFQIRTAEGGFIANVYGDRIELPTDDEHCYFVWLGDRLIVGIGSRIIGVRVFDDKGREILPSVPVVIQMEDFYPSMAEAA